MKSFNLDKSLYKILDVPSNCNQSSIMIAYMMKQQELEFAKSILYCPLKRKMYDESKDTSVSLHGDKNMDKSMGLNDGIHGGIDVPHLGNNLTKHHNSPIFPMGISPHQINYKQNNEFKPEPMSTGDMYRKVDGNTEEKMDIFSCFESENVGKEVEDQKINFGDLLRKRYEENNRTIGFELDTSSDIDDISVDVDDGIKSVSESKV